MLPSKPEPDQVLFLYEILEAILLLIDQRTLLLSQRVCRRWNEVILDSSRLQIKLCFRPARFERNNDHIPLEHQWNMMVQDLARPILTYYSGAGLPDEYRIDLNKKDAFLREEASWRRLLLHQPPCVKAASILVKSIGLNLFSRAKFKDRDNFLRLGNLEVAILEGTLLPRTWRLMFCFRDPISGILVHDTYFDMIRAGIHPCGKDCSEGVAIKRRDDVGQPPWFCIVLGWPTI